MAGRDLLHPVSLPLRRVTHGAACQVQGYPFGVPAIAATKQVEFTAPVTFLVGENGSGKSTWLEAVALAAQAIAVGSHDLERDESLSPLAPLADTMRLVWARKTRRGFYLRSEDFLGFARRISQMQADLERQLNALRAELGSGPAFERAAYPYRSQLGALRGAYGAGIEARSHGEGFFEFFQRRLVPGGLYLLDEPEVALSPARQFAFMSLLQAAVTEGAQFIIATHSPILMAFPDAVILDFDRAPLQAVPYDALEHVSFTREFLSAPERFLRHLREDSG